MPGNRPDAATVRSDAIDGIVTLMQQHLEPPIALLVGPWPLTADSVGIGDDVHRALLVDDWTESGMRAKQLQRLIDAQLVARNRQLSGDHPRGRDLGITRDGELVGRLLIDLDDDRSGPDTAPITVVDIAVHPQRQHQGVGRAVRHSLLSTARQTNREVHVTAVFGTPALAWFLAAGFVEAGGDPLYHRLRWQP